MSQLLERAISRFRRLPADGGRDDGKRTPGMASRAAVEARMQNLERDIGELKNRLNGLTFVVMGAVIELLPKMVQ